MTDTTTPVTTGGEAQPMADANITVESIINSANTEQSNATKEQEPSEPPEQKEPEGETERPWPKKAQNALAKEKGRTAKLKFERDQALAEVSKLREQPATKQSPQQQPINPDGAPNEADYKTYDEYLKAHNKFVIKQEFDERDKTTQKTQENQQYQQWETERLDVVDKQSEEFAKEFPDVTQLFNENANLIKSYPPALKRALLAADNAPLAFYNLAKEDKLEDLAEMSIEDAKVEIRLAQMKPAAKPRTKAPTPLPASRGSVPAGKSLEQLSHQEAHALLSKKD